MPDTHASTSAPAAPSRHAVILAGGSGTRLWPLSRNLFPKQLLALDGSLTLLQQTASRILSVFGPDKLWIVTGEEHVFEVRSQLAALHPGLDAQVLAEPQGRNTLPAILLALDRIAQSGGELVAVFPSDHMVDNLDGFAATLEHGMELAGQGRFVTFGVAPRKPETGYGYIARGAQLGGGAYEAAEFIEKPGLSKALEFLRGGRHYWNSGMFVFRAKELLSAVARHAPELWAWWQEREAKPLVQGYGKIPNISVDYGIVEKIRNIAVVEARFDWDDLGNWEAIYRLGEKDGSGNVIQGDVLALDCKDCLLMSQGGKLAVVGLTGMIVIQTRDATLSLPLTDVQRVKEIVALLKAQGSQLVESHLTVKRPWGSYSVLEEGPHYKIKRIEVLPGARLSLQMHHHRSEHWVVVSGTALVEIGGEERLLVENQAVDIAKATTHRLANPGKVPLEIIEIQSGPYLEEDDIVRFDDVYGRIKGEDS